jgi:hypothetical protein
MCTCMCTYSDDFDELKKIKINYSVAVGFNQKSIDLDMQRVNLSQNRVHRLFFQATTTSAL